MWNYDPFSGERVKDDDGEYRIYGRGSQDMKIIGILLLIHFYHNIVIQKQLENLKVRNLNQKEQYI